MVNQINEETAASANRDWRLLAARWKIGCLVFLVCFGTFTSIVFSLTPMYKAQTQILLPVSTVEDPSDRRNLPVNSADASVVHSYTDIVKDDSISEQVISKLDLQTNPEFNRKPGMFAEWLAKQKEAFLGEADGPSLFNQAQLKQDAVLQDYQGRLKATNDSKSLTLGLSFQASDPFLAQRIVDEHAQAFVRFEVERRQIEAAAKASWMKAELDRAAEEARAAQVAVQLHMSTPSAARSTAADQITDLKFQQMVAASKQAIYETTLRRYQDLIADERYDGSGIRVLSPATLPTRPDFPKKALLLPLGALMSAILSIVIAWIVSIVRRKETFEEVLARLQLEKLGRVHFPRSWRFLFVGRKARLRTTLFWEQMAELRSSLCLPASSDGHVLAISSSVAKEGKSLLAAGLARTFACSGAKTLLLDLNVRNPRFFGADREGSTGLQAVLAGASVQRSLVSIDKDTPLYLLASSRGTPIDVLLLTGTRMRSVLKQLRKQFDVIIIDTPALEVVSDTLLIGAFADEIVLASMQSTKTLLPLQDAVAKLRSRSISIRGVVATDHRRPPRHLLAQMKPYINGSRPHVVWPASTTDKAHLLSWRERDKRTKSTASTPQITSA